jgi:hypothetical protein
MKHLYLECQSINEFAEDSPNMVHVQLNDKDVERIVMLASWIAQAKTYKVSEFFGADYYDKWNIIEDDKIDMADLVDAVPERTDLDMIHVVNRHSDVFAVGFSTIPKHCGDSDKIMTDYVDIVDLLAHDVINQIEV